MDVVEVILDSDFDGCKLTDLWYDEDTSASSSAEQYDSDEAIVLHRILISLLPAEM